MKLTIHLIIAVTVLNLFWFTRQSVAQESNGAASQGLIVRDVPQKVDTNAHYLFYLHGRIVEQGRRPISPQYGVYEYDQILDTFMRTGFVVISEQRKKDTDVEQYGAKVADQVGRLIKAGVPPQNVAVVGASQGSWIAMLASTYLQNRKVNFVFIAACSADEGFRRLVNLHGNILFISERTDLPGSCRRFRDDATGISDYKQIEVNTGLRHGFLYRPIKEWVEPTIAWAQAHSEAGAFRLRSMLVFHSKALTFPLGSRFKSHANCHRKSDG